MSPLRRATSGFHAHSFRAELLPDRPTHAAREGDAVALCGATVERVFVRQWADGPEVGACSTCKAVAERAMVTVGH
jgi:hypothetical protein